MLLYTCQHQRFVTRCQHGCHDESLPVSDNVLMDEVYPTICRWTRYQTVSTTALAEELRKALQFTQPYGGLYDVKPSSEPLPAPLQDHFDTRRQLTLEAIRRGIGHDTFDPERVAKNVLSELEQLWRDGETFT